MTMVRTNISVDATLWQETASYRDSGQLNVSAVCRTALWDWLYRLTNPGDTRTPLDKYTMSELTSELDRRAKKMAHLLET